MAKYRFTNSAVKDLTEIWDYTKKIWSEKQAEKYYQLIIQACSEIAKDPFKGKEYYEVYPELKGLKTNKHIIFYREMTDKSIEISRILHERMDLKSRLK
ncbi:MAG: type II toxin-antitoxin system RelE/ParE family toxin [Crocinitomicaceae bacterium]|nr:type II toxin-antitoxin system RelE/ParE family toxin [Crocinitomicaceae bacterium]MBK8924928.1 type II toxin-antitoxin system RelE/ParE family toxin [Crocinitomicaceae bacterium]